MSDIRRSDEPRLGRLLDTKTFGMGNGVYCRGAGYGIGLISFIESRILIGASKRDFSRAPFNMVKIDVISEYLQPETVENGTGVAHFSVAAHITASHILSPTPHSLTKFRVRNTTARRSL